MVQSDTRPSEVEILQDKKLISFDIKEVEIKDEMNSKIRTGFEYSQVKVSTTATTADIIEAIISSKYSVGAEVALTNDKEIKQDEYRTYQDFRLFAKELSARV